MCVAHYFCHQAYRSITAGRKNGVVGLLMQVPTQPGRIILPIGMKKRRRPASVGTVSSNRALQLRLINVAGNGIKHEQEPPKLRRGSGKHARSRYAVDDTKMMLS